MDQGYKYIPNFLTEDELRDIERVCDTFHSQWLKENEEFYKNRAINSAYLTHSNKCSSQDRMVLFELIGSCKIRDELKSIFIKGDPAFLNTQLFFDPFNKSQENYWHRDIQYTDHSIEEQKLALENSVNNVVHFRLALKDENGIELIPGSHARWDTDQEFKTRMALDGGKPSDDLENGQKISLNRGDLLIFSANMIHRGLYGRERKALDILYCERDREILKFANKECMPTKDELNSISFQELFYLNENLG